MSEITILVQLTALPPTICKLIYSYVHFIIIKYQNTFFHFNGTEMKEWAYFHHPTCTYNNLTKLDKYILFFRDGPFYALDVENNFESKIRPMKIVVPSQFRDASSKTKVLQRTSYIFNTDISVLEIGDKVRYITIDNNMYLVSSGNVQQYNFESKSWSMICTTFKPGVHCTVVNWKHYLVAIGGYLASSKPYGDKIQAATYFLDTQTLTTEQFNPMPKHRIHFSTTVFDDRVYVFVGQDESINFTLPSKESYYLDCSTKIWHQIADMPVPCIRHLSVRLGNFIYVFTQSKNIFRYCPDSNAWSSLDVLLPGENCSAILY